MTRVILHELTTDDTRHRNFAEEAVAVLTSIVNEQRFLDEVRRGRYSSPYRHQEDGRRVKVAPAEIAQLITGGVERGSPSDEAIDLRVVVQPLASGTVGYVLPPEPLIYTNLSYYDDWMTRSDPLSLAAHWMHEWMHVVGFYHPWLWKRRDVPYRVGDLVALLGRELAAQALGPVKNVQLLGAGYLEASAESTCPVTERRALRRAGTAPPARQSTG